MPKLKGRPPKSKEVNKMEPVFGIDVHKNVLVTTIITRKAKNQDGAE